MPRLTAIVPASDAPSTLEACLKAIRAADEPPEEVVVARTGEGPAAARNEGARLATGDVLVFVDADVLPHADAFVRIRRAFDGDGELVALFGSYDDTPTAPGVVSSFRNLLHHHVHQEGAGRAETFWAGLGAVRREAFTAAGGFDERRYRTPSIEDVELGARLHRTGARIELDPQVQSTHLKGWTLASMLRTDLWSRGVPWVELALRDGPSSTLNLGWRHRASAALSVVAALSLLRGKPRPAAGSLLVLVVLNRRFYALLARRRGPLEAGLGVGLHVAHHLVGATSIPLGIARHLRARRDA
ncbi:MAG: glycosyl transferase [Candidatus Rokuibacteriota bacterium]|nr:MAG: glycosyl transferase [Candidatus Rokubacteria bacterium]